MAKYPENWKELSRALRKADNYTCNDCNTRRKPRYTNTHHVVPNDYNWLASADLHEPWNLRTVCKPCHGLYYIPEEPDYNFHKSIYEQVSKNWGYPINAYQRFWTPKQKSLEKRLLIQLNRLMKNREFSKEVKRKKLDQGVELMREIIEIKMR